jgi:CheY-like chemotaxis protein
MTSKAEREMILAIVDDLIFLSKIQQAADVLRVPLEIANPADAEPRATGCAAVLIDLNHRSGAAVDMVRRIKANPATQHLPVVGFLSHVQADLAVQARAARCDMVLARSAFTQQLPRLLEELSGKRVNAARKKR